MTGVIITKNVNSEIRRKLGFGIVAAMSFSLGVPYPLPDWYSTLSACKKTLWMMYCRFGDLMTILLFISNVLELFTHYSDLRAFITCTGTITYIICLRIKLQIYKRKAGVLEKVIESLHRITENLDNNPVKNRDFFEIYQEYFKHVTFFATWKIRAIAGGVCTLALYEMTHGYLQEFDSKRHLPMFGWYPYDPYQLANFEITCLFQLISYSSFLLRDVVVDLLFVTILLTINTHFVHLGILLGQIVELSERPVGLLLTEDKKPLLRWWIKHHQMVLKTIEDFKEITNPYLLYKYISVFIILFFGGVLVTSEIEYDWVQQLIVLAINSSNLFQLYIFSLLGDAITENGLRMHENALHLNILQSDLQTKRLYLYIVTRCSKSVLIHFGQINPLCVASFLQIVKVTFSYFITIVQIRHKAVAAEEAKLLLVNSTQS